MLNKAVLHQIARHRQGTLRVGLRVLAKRIVELLGQERFRRFGAFTHVAHLGEQIGQRAALLLNLVHERLGLARVAQSLALRIGALLDALADFFLALRQLPRLVPHRAHFLGELVGVLLAKIIAELLQIALGPRAGGQRLRNGLFVQSLGGLLHLRSGLIKLLPGVGHAGLVFRPVHALAQFIHVREQVALFVAQAFEFIANVLALRLSLRFLKRRL